MCLCTCMLYDPSSKIEKEDKKIKEGVFKRLKNIKHTLFLKDKK